VRVASPRPGVYQTYLLGVLMLMFAFSTVDRLALGLVLQDIKTDLALSDTQLGMLTGIAFALFYAAMGIPLARWADRGNRVTIISVTTLLWCMALALSGLAGSFLQLLLIRIGVAVGEAGCTPTAHSLIADYFPRAERPRALARYMLGAPLSAVIGFLVAGWLNELVGWRVMFAILAVPGLALAALAALTLREPRCIARSEEKAISVPQPALKEVFATLWAITSFRHLLACFAVVAFFASGISKWMPAFFVRTHGLTTGELGTWLAAIYGLGSLIGIYWGGELASRYATSNERLQLKVIAAVYVVCGILYACVYLSPNSSLAFALLGLLTVVGGAANGPVFAAIQTLVPDRMRAQAVALIYLSANLVGLGLGPLAVGALSDALRASLNDESLRYALVALCPGYLWAAWHMWRGSLSVAHDLQMGSRA
jgi:MFS family permease